VVVAEKLQALKERVDLDLGGKEGVEGGALRLLAAGHGVSSCRLASGLTTGSLSCGAPSTP
jgi:hypothetical protein